MKATRVKVSVDVSDFMDNPETDAFEVYVPESVSITRLTLDEATVLYEDLGKALDAVSTQ
jgi:hypothetical protein